LPFPSLRTYALAFTINEAKILDILNCCALRIEQLQLVTSIFKDHFDKGRTIWVVADACSLDVLHLIASWRLLGKPSTFLTRTLYHKLQAIVNPELEVF
jgi:hypothetical protein